MSLFASFIHFVANEIPEFGLFLPFIDQAWCLSDQKSVRRGLHQQGDVCIQVNAQHTSGHALGGLRLAAGFGSPDENGSRRGKLARQFGIYCAWLIGHAEFG